MTFTASLARADSAADRLLVTDLLDLTAIPLRSLLGDRDSGLATAKRQALSDARNEQAVAVQVQRE